MRADERGVQLASTGGSGVELPLTAALFVDACAIVLDIAVMIACYGNNLSAGGSCVTDARGKAIV